MESSPDVGVSVTPGLEINGKRLVTEEQDGDLLESSSPKRIRSANPGFEKDVKKVAEIVLVLSALGKMRGGKGPSEVERELMEAARITLAKVCEDFSPKEVFPKEAFGALIEDLGLNKLKDQKLGSRSPKISIAEKLLASKKKMEKAEEFAIASAHSSHHQGNTVPTGEGRSGLHPARTSSDKPMHVSVSGGALQPGRNSGLNSTSLSYQLPTSEIRPVPLSGTAMPRDDGSYLRSANHSANKMVKTSTWQVQHATGVPLNFGSDVKVPVHGFVPQATSRTFAAQTIGGLQPQGVNPVQTFSLRNTHIEIVKIVQKLLKPKATESPTWDPPSRDYMNKALTCQICMSMATDVDSILICDACENGYHYAKCLGMKEVPRVEWHCAKCLSLSNGKPLPPKYGRVMRNANAAKMPSNSETGLGSSTIQSDALDEKVSQPRASLHGSIAMGSNSNVASESPSDPNMLGSSIPNSSKASNPMDTSRTSDDISTDAQPNPSAEHTNFVDTSVDTANCLETRPLEESYDTHAMLVDSKEHQNVGDLLNDNQVLHKYPAESILSSSNVNQDISAGNDTHAIHQWNGEPISISGDNYFYDSCFINGHLYNILDHALMRFDNGKIVPARIQAFWEDKSSATNWVTVNQCYFPDDFPESVGRPCGLENNEVCESTSSHSCSISSIYGPCLILPPRKFAEESERRARLAEQPDDHLPPLYLCKWVYDETKGLFRDASSFPSS